MLFGVTGKLAQRSFLFEKILLTAHFGNQNILHQKKVHSKIHFGAASRTLKMNHSLLKLVPDYSLNPNISRMAVTRQ
jgi:hypothetical protein